MDNTVVRLPADLAAEVDALARSETRSRSNAAQVLIREALQSRLREMGLRPEAIKESE